MSDEWSDATVEDDPSPADAMPDEAVEAAASADKTRAFTLAFCTYQWDCTSPL